MISLNDQQLAIVVDAARVLPPVKSARNFSSVSQRG